MSIPSTQSLALLKELLAFFGCKALWAYYADLNLPTEVAHSPVALCDRANLTLTRITTLDGNFFAVLDRANELFQEFVVNLVEEYSSGTVHQLIDWIKRHGIDHDYFAGLTLWSLTLCKFDGWIIHNYEPSAENQLLIRGFATYKHLLSSNNKLCPSWIDEKVLTIRDGLESNQLLGYRGPFLERYSRSEQMDFIEIQILGIEHAYRFLSDLKHYCDDSEQKQFVECAKLLGSGSGWPPSLIDQLTICFANIGEKKEKRDSVN